MVEVSSTKDGAGKRSLALAGVVARPLRDVWELLSDTSRLNEVVYGLPPLTIVEAGPDKIRGRASVAGFDLDFDEHPWVYEAPRHYKSVRAFTSGPIERLEVTCDLEPVAESGGPGTRVSYRVALTAKSGPVGWAAEKVFASRTEDGLEKLAKILDHQTATVRSTYQNADERVVRTRARGPASHLTSPLASKLVDAVATLPDEEVTRLRPYALAEAWGAPRPDVLALCLHAVSAELLEMRWDTLCPSCKAPLHSSEALDALLDTTRCPVCEIDVDVSRSNNVEAVFAPVIGVRAAERGAYCLGSPQRTPHWLAQLVLEPGAVYVLQSRLGAGRYRVQSPGIAVRTIVDVGETGDEHVRVTLEGQRGATAPTLPAATPNVRAGAVKLTLTNEDARPRRIQLVNEGFADLSATASHVVETDAWRTLFGAAA